MPTGLTAKQAKTAKIIKTKVKAGEALSQTLLKDATIKGYELVGPVGNRTVGQIAGDISGKNLRSAQFLAALGFDHKDVRQHIGEEIFKNLNGDNPIFPKDKDIYRDSLKIASKAAFEERHHLTIGGSDFAGRSTMDLEFFVKNHRWPDEAPILDAEFEDGPNN